MTGTSQQELEEGAVSIEALVESLDRQKDEAIIRTFRGVSRHFADVFKELVPNGHGAEWRGVACTMHACNEGAGLDWTGMCVID